MSGRRRRRSSESDGEYEQRIACLRENRRIAELNRQRVRRANLTSEQRRQESIEAVGRAESSRANERNDEREARLLLERERQSQARTIESEYQREARLAANRDRTNERLRNESVEQREARLAANRDRTNERLRNESEVHTSERLALNRDRNRVRRENESEAEYEARLSAMREYNTLTNDNMTVDNDITQNIRTDILEAERRSYIEWRVNLPEYSRNIITEADRILNSQSWDGMTDYQRDVILEVRSISRQGYQTDINGLDRLIIRESQRLQQEQHRVDLDPFNRLILEAADRLTTDRLTDQTDALRRDVEERRDRELMTLLREEYDQSNRYEARTNITPTPFTLNLRNKLCIFGCNALRFEGHELKLGKCCNKGATILDENQQLITYPNELKYLLIGDHPYSRNFFKYIRRYNSAFSFASLGSKSVTPPGQGPYCYKVHGQIYHRSGTMHPENNENRQYSQLYILENNDALISRMDNNVDCNRHVMSLIQETLASCNNPYITAYKNLHRIEQEELSLAARGGRDPHVITMVFNDGPDRRRYNAPSNANEVAAVFVGDGGVPGKHELCVYPTTRDSLSRIPGQLYKLISNDYFTSPVNGINTLDFRTINPDGIPPHDLFLKEGCIVRLMERLDNYPQLNVGDRLKVTELNNHYRGFITCNFNDNIVILNKHNFTSSHLNHNFIRSQFPVKLDNHLDTLCSRNSNVDPMIYPLIFPSGERGWHQNMTKNNRPNSTYNRISQCQFYCYRFAFRQSTFSPLHYYRKLFQQYVVDSWLRIESNRLNFHRQNQSKLRVHKYLGLMDHYENECLDSDRPPGKPIILPSTFVSGPRYMRQNYQDAMSMVSKFGKPSLFITFTCNPKHKDIVDNLGNFDNWPNPPLTASDRPDVVAAVFKYHLDQLKKDIKNKMGKHIADIHVIEYQKRGLPHAHILIWLTSDSQLRTPDQIDSLISAEIPDPILSEQLHKIITTQMLHGPCGLENPSSQCMVDGNCSKSFPKAFQEETHLGHDGYPLYKRRNNGRTFVKNGITYDNRHVVPYCPYLSAKYNAHINVEACTSIKSIKYIFKYVYKGYDCASIERTEYDPNTFNEIKSYLDTRYVSAPEAMWRINEYEVCHKSHHIERLDIHLPLQQPVVFNEDDNMEEVLDRNEITKLNAYFKLNQYDPNARNLLYTDIPYYYSWQSNKTWKKRVLSRPNIVSRMYYVSPKDRERFHLRLLLLHVTGAQSFNDLKFYNDISFDTFEESCRARGLLIDDTEWNNTLNEATTFASPIQIRNLFTTILGSCDPSDPIELWENYKTSMCEDFMFNNNLSTRISEQYALRSINSSLLQNYGIHLTSFGFSLVDDLPDLNDQNEPIDHDTEHNSFIQLHNSCNEEQRLIVDSILHEINQYSSNDCFDRPRAFFIDAPGGCGKTYLANTLISYILSQHQKVASCAWTGIAANLLRYGQTVHSLFKLPLNITETTTCNITTYSKHADFIKSLSMIFIDEASMIPSNALKAIDIMLRDITGSNAPFGGKLLVFAGDFRQTLPIIPKAQPAKIIENCINNSHLWQHIIKFKLTQNMRANENEQQFCDWLINLGNNNLHSSHQNTIPAQFDIPSRCNLTHNIVDSIYPDFTFNRNNNIILTPLNSSTHIINDQVLKKFNPEIQSCTYFSSDSVIEDEENEVNNLSTEFLHSLTPGGLPLHKLDLKVGAPIILLRNIDSKNGLCNGTRLTVTYLGDRCIEAEIISGSPNFVGNRVLIPRIKLIPSDSLVPFKFQRIQFPIRLSFCMTINKSQGQTYDKVGIYLPEPCFGHGQMYVAFSRARCFEDISIQILNTSKQLMTDALSHSITMNVVYNIFT